MTGEQPPNLDPGPGPGEENPPASSEAPPEAEHRESGLIPLSILSASEPTPPELAPSPRQPERDPFWGYGDLFLFFGLAVPALLLGVGLVKGAEAIFHLHFAAKAIEPIAEQLIGYLLLFGALKVLFRIEYNRPFWRSLGWSGLRIPFLAVVVCGIGAAFVVALIGAMVSVRNTPNAITDLMRDKTSMIVLAVFGITLGPISEELAFRGFLQPLLVRSLGAAAGIILAAIPFGLLHYQEYGNSWPHAAIVAAAGVAFGCMRHFTGSTKAAALMHAAYNALFFAVVAFGPNQLPQ